MGSIGGLLLVVVVVAIRMVGGDLDLIQKTCKNTKHYQLCVSSLESSSKVADPKGLAIIMIGVGVANATATSLYLTSSSSSSSSSSPNDKRLLKECADMYGYAADSLQACVEDLQDLESNYDYAYMHLMAASDYPNACHNSFTLHKGLLYPPHLAYREQAFLHICDVVFGIINALS